MKIGDLVKVYTKDGEKHGMLVGIKKRYMVGETCEVNLGDRIEIFVAEKVTVINKILD